MAHPGSVPIGPSTYRSFDGRANGGMVHQTEPMSVPNDGPSHPPARQYHHPERLPRRPHVDATPRSANAPRYAPYHVVIGAELEIEKLDDKHDGASVDQQPPIVEEPGHQPRQMRHDDDAPPTYREVLLNDQAARDSQRYSTPRSLMDPSTLHYTDKSKTMVCSCHIPFAHGRLLRIGNPKIAIAAMMHLEETGDVACSKQQWRQYMHMGIDGRLHVAADPMLSPGYFPGPYMGWFGWREQ